MTAIVEGCTSDRVVAICAVGCKGPQLFCCYNHRLVAVLEMLYVWHRDAVVLASSRGKVWSKGSVNLGPLTKMVVPHAWFTHFYAVGVVANLACLAGVLVAGQWQVCRQATHKEHV